jgi:hypothetical protein
MMEKDPAPFATPGQIHQGVGHSSMADKLKFRFAVCQTLASADVMAITKWSISDSETPDHREGLLQVYRTGSASTPP